MAWRVVLLVAIGAGGCASSQVKEVWVDPRAQTSELDRVVALYMGPDKASQRVAEDEMAKQIRTRGVEAVPGYMVIADSERNDTAAVARKLKSLGFEGAVVMRLVGVDERISATSAGPAVAPYGSFYGYYGYAYPVAMSPTYLTTDQVVRMQTTVYSLEQDRLLYAATSETFNPKSATDLVDDISKAVGKDMEKRGLID